MPMVHLEDGSLTAMFEWLGNTRHMMEEMVADGRLNQLTVVHQEAVEYRPTQPAATADLESDAEGFAPKEHGA